MATIPGGGGLAGGGGMEGEGRGDDPCGGLMREA